MIKELEEWFEKITTPRLELGNIPICPFAKAVTVNNEYTIEATTFEAIANQVGDADIQKYKICIYYLTDYELYTAEVLEERTETLNHSCIKNNKILLSSDPRIPFIVNGVSTNFPNCYIWIVQDLADLIQKSESLKLTGYYKHWTQKQIDEVVTWRSLIKT